MILIITSGITRAGSLSADEQAFFGKHTSDLVRLEPKKLDSAPVTKAFSASFYAVKIIIKQADGDMSNDVVVVKQDDKLVNVSRPSTDTDLLDFPKLMNPDFKLKSDDDASVLQKALDETFPIMGSDDKKAEGFKHSGSQWIFFRGTFFKDKLGYIFDVGDDGSIKSVKFKLQLPG